MANSPIVILPEYTMTADKDIAVDLMTYNEYPEFFTIGICWRLATGTLDGTVKIYGTNYAHDVNDYVLLGTCNINAANNVLNKYQLVVTQCPFRNLLIKYAKNNITGGKLYIDLYKRDL